MAADRKMERKNQTIVTEFILLGLSDDPNIQSVLFATGLLIYMFALAGNLAIIVLIWTDQHLQTPMYFLLRNLAITDIGYVSSTTPKILWNLMSGHKTISFAGCAFQMFCFLITGGVEGGLYTVMAYDRYAAICHPLHYTLLMNQSVLRWLLAACWTTGGVNATFNTAFVFSLNFCGPNKIVHFFCDIPPVLNLSCSDTSLAELVTFVISGGILVASVSIIFVSYVLIVLAVLKISTAQGRMKTFSTCTSHLTAVSLSYSTAILMYATPSSVRSREVDRVISVLYTVTNPLLNPLIYSFKNKEMQAALLNLLGKKQHS
ncbi:olfactory receptor 5B21-like [Heteronotia binoei]|uniref:olfactory receptor 5B21-like n=1 Tax=Heteronotia binoei TaxID=13085 RepID=UPI00292F66AD|nr:olfactory receptor 5B21-like [Heteronotia binoei]